MENEELSNIICDTINVCSCNRYLDRIIIPLKKLIEKLIKYDGTNDNIHYLAPNKCTDEELLLIALLDRRCNLITHGINIEYPIAMIDDWKILLEYINKYIDGDTLDTR